MRHFAMTGIVTASWISSILSGSDMRATPPSRADVGRNALERHHRDGAGILGDLRLLGVDDVHDHAALEHLGEAALDAHRAGLGHEESLARGNAVGIDRKERSHSPQGTVASSARMCDDYAYRTRLLSPSR